MEHDMCWAQFVLSAEADPEVEWKPLRVKSPHSQSFALSFRLSYPRRAFIGGGAASFPFTRTHTHASESEPENGKIFIHVSAQGIFLSGW